jgi:hypothetical protein
MTPSPQQDTMAVTGTDPLFPRPLHAAPRLPSGGQRSASVRLDTADSVLFPAPPTAAAVQPLHLTMPTGHGGGRRGSLSGGAAAGWPSLDAQNPHHADADTMSAADAYGSLGSAVEQSSQAMLPAASVTS